MRPRDAAEHLAWWLAWACRCRIPAFVTLAKTVRANRDRILASVELGRSTGLDRRLSPVRENGN